VLLRIKMELQIKISASERLALRDPEDTVLGRNIVRKGLILIHELGLEQFTFKKLANEINTTEASIYRYFENKHRLLLYLLTWYWNYMEYMVVFHLQNMTDPTLKIKKIIELLVKDLPESVGLTGIDNKALHYIVIAESSKVYLTHEVESINKDKLFKPYKDLCARIADIFLDYNKEYPYSHSLSSTLMETSHFQYYFMLYLPSLTDFGAKKNEDHIIQYLEHVIFNALDSKHIPS
jgi:AcrR family transcriptional regulator